MMKSTGVDAYIINGSDPHGSEYPSKRWRTREWISGFTGSAGTVVITGEKAGLWVDFRYWIQAPAELNGSGIDLYREGEEYVPGIGEWLSDNLVSGSLVAYDGRTVSARTAGEWEDLLQESEIRVDSSLDFVSELWSDRPDESSAPVFELTEDVCGESRSSRLNRLVRIIEKEKTDSWIGIALDSAAWLLNVRGSDVPYNPVVNGFLIFAEGRFTWFTDMSRITDSMSTGLGEDGVLLAEYNEFYPALANIPVGSKVLIDQQSITRAVLDHLPDNVNIKNTPDPVILMKARKNAVEASEISKAMVKDGAAMVRFMIRLERAMEEGRILTELDATGMLLEERSSMPGFLEESFSPIPAFGSHGAICHYEATAEGAFTLEPGPNLLLLDSGGQWEEGTTDITRTIALGRPSEMQIRDYTLILKGHVALSRVRFPRGTRGYQLDILARGPMWQEGVNFGHGTGHGVGFRLNVHEGPHKISPDPIDVALEPGMVVSNEPGIYRENSYGIRIENLLICREDITTDFGTFLAFDTLTLAPYDRRLIDTDLMSEDEIEWINQYHGRVFSTLGSILNDAERVWLNSATAPFQL